MKAMLVAAKERFTAVGHDNKGSISRGRAQTAEVHSDRWLIYVCPACHTETGFDAGDFHRQFNPGTSNLLYQDRQAVEKEAAAQLTNENGFVDFYCTGCTGAVRIYYRYEPPERSQGLLELRTVVEHASSVAKPN